MDQVSLAMVLAVDGSASVTYEEFGLIAGGMAAALRDPQVMKGLIGGDVPQDQTQGSLLSLLLWSGEHEQSVITDWTALRSATDVLAFAEGVENMPRLVLPGQTAIGEALLAALTLLGRAPAVAKRSIVNVVGDGRSNDGIAPGPIRDRMVQADIVINGLCVLHEEPNLLADYIADVIGGPGAFAVTCGDYGDFAQAMRQKLTRELTGPIV